eukprot:s1143_g5.t1
MELPPCSSNSRNLTAHKAQVANMACQFSEGWSGTPMWQLAQGREAMVRKEREAKEAQAGDVLNVESEAGGFRSVLWVSKMVGDKYEDAKVAGDWWWCVVQP